jgi:hypothetical protein
MKQTPKNQGQRREGRFSARHNMGGGRRSPMRRARLGSTASPVVHMHALSVGHPHMASEGNPTRSIQQCPR